MNEKREKDITLGHNNDEYGENVELFPSLKKFKIEHNTANLQKLCVEISEFCRAVYASTRSDEERAVYRRMLEKLEKTYNDSF